MRVFVSSTCYDLIDLRAELRESLEDLGVESLFSDLKESDFKVLDGAAINSIETCLHNVRTCDKFVLILSQRYGPVLGGQFGQFSATHLEYEEAARHQKPRIVYLRDRLIADWSSWKRNGRVADFKPVWAKKKDVKSLFSFIDAHQALHRKDGGADENNFFLPFRDSVDLRTHLRRELAGDASSDMARRLVEKGEVPIVVVSDVTSSDMPNAPAKLNFVLMNVGSVAAINVVVTLETPPMYKFNVRIPVILSGVDTGLDCEQFAKYEFDRNMKASILSLRKDGENHLTCEVLASYTTPLGHRLADRCRIILASNEGGELIVLGKPEYLGKEILGKHEMLMSELAHE